MVNTHGRDHRQSIGAGAAERHEVKEVVHEAARILQENEGQADGQQEDVRQNRLLMLVDLGEHFRQKVFLAHRIEHAYGGHPESQNRSGHPQQDGNTTVHDRPEFPSQQILHGGDDHETVRGIAGKQIPDRCETGHAEEEDRVDRTAGEHGSADGLLRVIDGEVTLFHHLGHSFETEIGRDEQCHADDPRRNAKRRSLRTEREHVRQIGDAPMTGSQDQRCGDKRGGDIGEQAERLCFDQELHVLQTHDEDEQQEHDADDHGGLEIQIQVEEFADERRHGHDHGRRHGNPSRHDKPGCQKADMLVKADRIVDELAARRFEQR